MAASMFRVAAPIFRLLSSNSRQCVRCMCSVPEAPSQYSMTKVTMLNKETSSGLLIDAYSPLGFKLNTGMRVIGPCAIFPKSILHWNVTDASQINEKSLELFTLLVPKLDILVIGKGDKHAKVNFEIIRYLKQHKINVEILNTDQACSTFNFLNAEHRYVAAALIPPENVEHYYDDEINLSLQLDYRELDTLETGFAEPPKGNFDGLPPHLTTPEEAIEEGIEKLQKKLKKGRMHEQLFPKGRGGEPKADND